MAATSLKIIPAGKLELGWILCSAFQLKTAQTKGTMTTSNEPCMAIKVKT
jgi:hypothetical protein